MLIQVQAKSKRIARAVVWGSQRWPQDTYVRSYEVAGGGVCASGCNRDNAAGFPLRAGRGSRTSSHTVDRKAAGVLDVERSCNGPVQKQEDREKAAHAHGGRHVDGRSVRIT